jgi:prefoldin subunit 5
MNELELVKEARRWLLSDPTKYVSTLSNTFNDLRQNLEPLNKELKELNSNVKKSKKLLSQLTSLQRGVKNQTNWLILLTAIMTIFVILQLCLTFLHLK